MVPVNRTLKTRSNKDVRIWRYLDFPKFISMLDGNSLFFSNLRDLDDPYEGKLPEIDQMRYKKDILKAVDNIPQDFELPFTRDRLAELTYEDLLRLVERQRALFLVNCWHINDQESASMWDIYSSRNKGIAIQSTYTRLEEALKKGDNKDVKIGIVKYRDYKKDKVHTPSLRKTPFTKRKSFEHEKELRAVITLSYTEVFTAGKLVKRKDRWVTSQKFHEEKTVGQYRVINLKKLLEKIYLSPNSEPWLNDLVKSMVRKYSLDENLVIKSDLYSVK